MVEWISNMLLRPTGVFRHFKANHRGIWCIVARGYICYLMILNWFLLC